jgi:hypothetical protein
VPSGLRPRKAVIGRNTGACLYEQQGSMVLAPGDGPLALGVALATDNTPKDGLPRVPGVRGLAGGRVRIQSAYLQRVMQDNALQPRPCVGCQAQGEVMWRWCVIQAIRCMGVAGRLCRHRSDQPDQMEGDSRAFKRRL